MGNRICLRNAAPAAILPTGLQAELQAAYQESECVKRKLKLQEAEMMTMRGKLSNREDEWETKFRKYYYLFDPSEGVHSNNALYIF